ncbi:uncharacterized protein LOC127255678 [Andrographis paniculata]|uniref:uncharacterized protein LOC127255678 n=1 Tax=Andrographis paniculata TaxID=175694 RepID=UPI0021E75FCC|nr:uncharacterized protein LOC127255678 [Andrographis paniculata]XP_051137301.1 uncharacterized protein LOC127255678 [Andrographis paniculata]
MEYLLGFKEAVSDEVLEGKSSSFKLVPWMGWDEWKSVRQSLFSSFPDRVAFALRRVVTWRSRGCIPVAIDVTASLVEIQQKDPFFRNDLNESSSTSEEMLAMLYSMAIMRLVNGVIEKTRRKNEISIGEAADGIGIPRMLIDIRHEGSHRDLPSVRLLRRASTTALEWLVSYYWEPQERIIPVQTEQTAKLRKEIRRGFNEVSLCLKAKQADKSNSSHAKGRRVRQTETLYARKFLFLVAGKSSHSSTASLKKQLSKSLRNIHRLYALASPEVVYVLTEYLLIALHRSKSSERLENTVFVNSNGTEQTAFDHWKSVVSKLSNKEPEFLLVLTQAVLEKLETEEITNFTTGLQPSDGAAKSRHTELLPCLFDHLIGNLKMRQKEFAEAKGSKTGKPLSKPTLLGLLRRCLLLSRFGNKHLLSSTVALAQMTGDASLLHKLKKLASLHVWNPDDEGSSVVSCDDALLLQNEDSLRDAEEKLQILKKLRSQQKNEDKLKQSEPGRKCRWPVAKQWNPCPIGMLPDTIGFSGRLPGLDCIDQCSESATVLFYEDNARCCKREAEIGTEEMDTSPVKKIKTIETDSSTQPNRNDNADADAINGRMMIDGVWRNVGEDELLALTSAVRLLI